MIILKHTLMHPRCYQLYFLSLIFLKRDSWVRTCVRRYVVIRVIRYHIIFSVFFKNALLCQILCIDLNWIEKNSFLRKKGADLFFRIYYRHRTVRTYSLSRDYEHSWIFIPGTPTYYVILVVFFYFTTIVWTFLNIQFGNKTKILGVKKYWWSFLSSHMHTVRTYVPYILWSMTIWIQFETKFFSIHRNLYRYYLLPIVQTGTVPYSTVQYMAKNSSKNIVLGYRTLLHDSIVLLSYRYGTVPNTKDWHVAFFTESTNLCTYVPYVNTLHR